MPNHSVTLVDPATASQADIFVGFGFNCYRFTTRLAGKSVDVIWSTPGFADGTHRASGSGIPLLFPFPGRIAGTQLDWQGKIYRLNEGDGRGNAIHGFVHERPWRVLSQSESHVTGQFQASIDDSALLNVWPSDFCLTVTYRLAGHRLEGEFEILNPGDVPLPCGLGAHPYFRVPLTTAGRAERCRLVLPVTGRWVLDQMIATGERAELEEAAGFQAGYELGSRRFDDVFTGLVPRGNRFVARIEDPLSDLATQIDFGAPFRECVVYTPDHREAVCIEPYTCVPGALQLQREGVDAGLLCIEPGQRVKTQIAIQVVTMP